MKRAYREMMWAIHNLVAHPISQLLWFGSLFGLIRSIARASEWVHDVTLPAPDQEDRRGR